MALDPQFVVIGGGLMDPQATSEAFRERYLSIVRNSALPYVWPAQARKLADRAGDTGRSVAGDRRGAGGAVSRAACEDEYSAAVPNLKLNSGSTIPQIGLGTGHSRMKK